jgi:DNA repair exonuclease SbcCD ATPase subunit
MSSSLKSVSTNSGFLQDCPVEFVHGLNCIIGARGTCKSTLVESIRFAFNHDPSRVAELLKSRPTEPGGDRSDAHLGLVRATLGAGSIRCEIEGSESALLVEREVDGDPRVFVEGVREHANPGLLDHIEIFSQGDLQRIADSDELRIHLIDRPNSQRVSSLRADRRKKALALSEIGPELRALRAQISALRQEVQPAAQLSEQLRQVQSGSPVVSPELDSQRRAFESRERLLEFVRTASTIRDELLQTMRGVSPLAERFRAILDDIAREPQSDEASDSEQLIAELQKIAASMRDSAEAARSIDLSQSLADLRKRFDDANARFYDLRQQEQSVNESLKKEHALRRQIEHLDLKQAKIPEPNGKPCNSY